jgi:hypothetical protein
VKTIYTPMLLYLDLYTEISGQNGKELQAVCKPNPVESIRFALGFANAGQIGGNYCEQNPLIQDQYRVRGVGLLEFVLHDVP